MGQPPVRTIGETVADRISAHYRFERVAIRSDDGRRVWRVRIGIPRVDPPEAGFPSLWMLDGNAALTEFDGALLEELAARPNPHALVFVGHDNDLRFDTQARYRDYTPEYLPPDRDGDLPPQLTGGADAFLEVIERKIRPQLAGLIRLAPQQQAIWGHSLGGLFVLHAAVARPGSFQTYVAASPSMWWGQGYAAKEAERLIAHNAGHAARIIILVGGDERKGDLPPRGPADPRAIIHRERLKGAPPDAASRLADRLKAVPGLDVTYREFPGLGHGPMFRASLMNALHTVTGISERVEAPRPESAGH